MRHNNLIKAGLTGIFSLFFISGVFAGNPDANRIVTPGDGWNLDLEELVTYAEELSSPSIVKYTTDTLDGYYNYLVLADITISENDKLTVYPGQRIIFTDSSELFIRGTLVADGNILTNPSPLEILAASVEINYDFEVPTYAQYCIFTSDDEFTSQTGFPVPAPPGGEKILKDVTVNPSLIPVTSPAGQWDGINFQYVSNPLPSKSYISYCQVENAMEGITCDRRDNVVINDNIVRNNHVGIYVRQSSPKISGNRIFFNQLRYSGDGVVQGTGMGIYCYGLGTEPRISSNEIINNDSNGIYIINYAHPNLNNGINAIYGNDHNNLYYNNSTTDQLDAYNNYWGTEDIEAIDNSIYDDDENINCGVVFFLPIYRYNPLVIVTPLAVPESVWNYYK